MSKTKVIVCSNSAIDYLDYPKSIDIFRSKIHFGSEAYDDYVDLSAKDFYERIKNEPNNIPKTSYVSPGHMLATFDELLKEGYENAFVITIARPLSGLHDAVQLLSQETKLNVVVYNSKTLAYPEAYMALQAETMFSKGKSVKDVIKKLDHIRDNNKMFFAVDTLLYLVKNGRLSKLQGTLGSLLSIKPVLSLDSEGNVITLEKIRTTKKAVSRIIDLYLESTKDKKVLTFISHAHNDETKEFIINSIKEVYPNREIVSSYLTPVVGAHAGPKAISIGYIEL